MLIWTLFGLGYAFLLTTVGLFSYIVHSEGLVVVVWLVAFAVPFFIKEDMKKKWYDCPVFKCVNPEIYTFISIIGIISMEGIYSLFELWNYFNGSLYWVLSVTFSFGQAFFYGFAFWLFASKFEAIVHYEKAEFFKKSWLYRLFDLIKRRKFERKVKKGKTSYSVLYGIIAQMAAGNLNVEIPPNLGKCQMFRDELVKLRECVKEAVDKEIKSERMRMELVSNVSHDLKTPLTAMITYIDLLEDDNLEPEKRKEYLKIIDERADRLKYLIEDLFEVTKASTGNVKFEPVKMDIVNLVKQVTYEYEDRFKERELSVQYDIPEGKVYINADSQKTYRIYSNLLGNVAKYALKYTRVYIDIKESDDAVCVVIKNISEDTIKVNPMDLSERFVRGDASRNTEGSGLGLAIARSFSELQGASFSIFVDGDLFKVVTIWKKAQ